MLVATALYQCVCYNSHSIAAVLFIASSGLLSTNNYNLNANTVCQKTRKANMSRKNACKRQPQLRAEVDVGKQMALEVCQKNFLDRKWNCTTSHSSYRRIMKTGWWPSVGSLYHTINKGCGSSCNFNTKKISSHQKSGAS